jgi:tetratricopeptide (TPR) repeat protein/deoxyadenosine/deoxycytidine kinase
MNLIKIRKNTGVNFDKLTPRELDILACLLEHVAAKKIAPILEISPKSVDTHVFNIGQKLEKYGRKNIIDFIKKSEYATKLQKRYMDLVKKFEFEKALKQIKQQVNFPPVSCKIICKDLALKKRLTFDLRTLNIPCFERKKDAIAIQPQFQDDYYQTFFKVLYQLNPHPVIEEGRSCFNNCSFDLDPIIATTKTNSAFLQIRRSLWWSIFTACFVFVSISFELLYLNYRALPVSIRSDFPVDQNILQRTNIFKKIQVLFQGKEPIQVVTLVGIGGAGKTTLARHYAKIQKASIVWEINAATQDSLLNDFEYLAYALTKTKDDQFELERIKKIENHQEYRGKLIFFVRQKLKHHPGWFLVFDNVENLPDIQPFFPSDHNTWGTGKILITTRNSNMGSNNFIKETHVIPIDELTSQEQFDLFCKVRGNPGTDAKKLKTFLQKIAPFPLDTVTVAHYIKSTDNSYDEYLNLLKTKNETFDETLIPLPTGIGNYKKTRHSIIACAVDLMLKKRKDFIDLLLLVSTVESQNIPKELLKKYAPLAVVDTFVEHMRQFSLLPCETNKITNSTLLSIHRSTQEIMRYYLLHKLTTEKQSKLFETATDALYGYAEDMIESFDLSKLRAFIPHLLSFLKQELSPSLKGKINLQLGRIYFYLGDAAKAVSHLTVSLKAFRQRNDDSVIPFVAKTLIYLGISKAHCGNFVVAKKTLKEGLKIYQSSLLHDHLGLAWGLIQYGRVICKSGQQDQAKQALEQGVAIYMKHYGENHPKTAWALLFLGDVYSRMGDTENAKHYYEKSLATHKSVYGDTHQKTAWILFRLGLIYKTDGNYIKALEYIEKSYNIYREKYSEHKDIHLLIEPQLGDTYRRLGLYKKSKQLFEQSRLVSIKQYGQNNICIQWSARLLGLLYIDTKNYKEAEKLLEKSIAIHSKNFGDDHIDTILAKHALANAYVGLNKFTQAEPLYHQCVQGYKGHYGNITNVHYAHLLCDFGHFYMLIKDFVAAENMFNEALSIFKKKEHAESYRCYEYLGDLAVARGQVDQISPHYTKAFLLVRNHFPKDSVHVVRLRKKHQQ